MSFEIIDPLRLYQSNGQVSQLSNARLAAAVANDQVIIAAVTGKRHRIMGWLIQSGGAGTTTISLKSNPAGSTLFGPFLLLANTAGTLTHLPIVDSGYAETSTGHSLVADVVTTGANIHIFYITYTPV